MCMRDSLQTHSRADFKAIKAPLIEQTTNINQVEQIYMEPKGQQHKPQTTLRYPTAS